MQTIGSIGASGWMAYLPSLVEAQEQLPGTRIVAR